MVSPQVMTLSEFEWSERERAHEVRTRPWVESRLTRQRAGAKHPVEDFLFNYYRFRPSLLQRWSPGAGVVLTGEGAEKFLTRTHYSRTPGGVWLNPKEFPSNRLSGLHWAIQILSATLSRDPQYGCFGLHEWAMVYRQEKGRHEEVPLRMEPEALAKFVESQRICCSHYDAFRFFTPPAQPLNQLQPQKGGQVALEQGGCLHTNMDLYKWTFKFSPWVSSEVLADTFALARSIREIDMRASPYDLRSQGYDPISIETMEGRKEYERWQKQFSEEARPLRERLLRVFEELVHNAQPEPVSSGM